LLELCAGPVQDLDDGIAILKEDHIAETPYKCQLAADDQSRCIQMVVE